MYAVLRDILFNFDAEDVHYFSMNAMKTVLKVNIFKKLLEKSFQYQDASLEKQVFGLPFKNPVGLGAGFDKNALYLKELETIGFGFVEIGTVTPLPQPGNEKPRLFRLPKDKAIINRMGFNNDGVKVVAARLRASKRNIIVGGNIGKNKVTANEDAWKDYEICLNELFDCVDYFVVNVSSPNTPGLRELQEKASLRRILSHLQNINQGRINTKPLLLKIAPDLTVGQLDDIIELAQEIKLSGLVATNTTISRKGLVTDKDTLEKIGAGGLSGMPLKEKSTQMVHYINRQTNGSIPLIASGGVFNGKDAGEKLAAGASLVQLWTGFIYEGPGIVKSICKELAD
ncbi:quinone-dependent dihydroorotate dehydrogenase [Segetibacter koreensis]|uniref:quinone-dependent dihydroorotate dehydrogenase n=1 Tax=Segetibacter koreensis TaxID=398037 RepID=UPI00037C0D63|nr:quinone-dependent dihydroorotate dehydrogenase [Segetibacter koreensis]